MDEGEFMTDYNGDDDDILTDVKKPSILFFSNSDWNLVIHTGSVLKDFF